MRTRGQSEGSVASESPAVSAIMAFVPMGPEASFFDALDRHRASLLALVKQGAGEAPAGVTRVVSRYSRLAGEGRPGRWPRGRRMPAAPERRTGLPAVSSLLAFQKTR